MGFEYTSNYYKLLNITNEDKINVKNNGKVRDMMS